MVATRPRGLTVWASFDKLRIAQRQRAISSAPAGDVADRTRPRIFRPQDGLSAAKPIKRPPEAPLTVGFAALNPPYALRDRTRYSEGGTRQSKREESR
jgi:hypothetical protein